MKGDAYRENETSPESILNAWPPAPERATSLALCPSTPVVVARPRHTRLTKEGHMHWM